MKEMKRILALVLCFVMLVGLVPPAEALIPKSAGTLTSGNFMRVSGDVIDAAIFCSDVHGHPDTVTSVFNGIKSMDATFNPTTAAFVGDTQCAASSVTAAAQSAFPGVACYYAYGNHDNEGNYGIANVTGLLYGDSTTNYYIYAISESSMGSSNPDTSDFTATVADLDKTKPLFIISHLPLHERRGDSNGAPAWYAAISAAAKEMDIFFFWAHNHTGETAVDRAAYYVPNDGSETITIEHSNADPVGLNFTYANAGYIDPPNTPARNNVATAVYIYSNRVDLVVCNEDGVLTGNYAVDVSVDRLHAASQPQETTPELTGIRAVSNKDVYYVGDELDITVYAIYSNNTEVPVEDYTTSGFDSVNTGKKSVFITYGNHTITLSVNVVEQNAEPVLTGIQVTYSKQSLLGENLTLKVVATYDNGTSVELTEGEYTVEGYDPTVTGAQGVIVTYKTQSYGFNIIKNAAVTVVADGMGSLTVTDVSETLTDALAEKLEAGFVAYDIVPNAYNVAKNVAVVSMPAPEGANAVYYWNEETQTLEPVSDFTFENGKAVFTTNHFSTYVVGTTATTGGQATVPGNSSTSTKDVWKLTSSLSNNGTYLIVNTNAAGSGYALLNNNGTVSAVAVTVVNDGTNTYIELDNSGAVWTATGSGTSWAFANNGSNLGYTRTENSYSIGSAYSYSLNTAATSAITWTLNSNVLSVSLQSGTFLGSSSGNTTYYLAGGNSWSMSTSSANIYFYTPGTISSTTGTQEATYGINILVNGTAASTMNANNVVNGDSVELGTEFTSTVSGQQPSGGSYAWTTTTNNGVASVDANGLVTFTGKAGTETVKVSYTWTVDNNSYTIDNTLVITATAKSYSMNIVETEATVKIGATQTLTFETKDSEGNDVTASNVTWTSSDNEVATVANGVVTGVAEGGANITAEWTDPADVKHTDTVAVTVVDAVYTLDLWTHDGSAPVAEITAPVALKNVTNGYTYSVWAVIKADGEDIGALEDPTLIEWISSDPSIATVDVHTGVITFTGKEGTVNITATYKVGNMPSDTITISASPTSYTIPEDGTTDFPEYPNEGAIRFDKTATAVGNFSETGIAQVELSMTGVPYTTGSEIDVVLMLDMTGSMTTDSMAAAEAAAKAFAEQIVKNEDGTYNKNRISVQVFNKNGVTELWAMSAVTEDTYSSLVTAIESASTKQASGGTPYSTALQECYEILYAAKSDGIGNNRSQYCVFVSDGTPTSVTYITNTTTPTTTTTVSFTRNNATYTQTVPAYSTGSSASTFYGSTSYHEYWSQLMINNGVTVFGVYTSVAAGSSGSQGSGGSGSGSVNDITEGTNAMTNVASSSDNVYVVEDYTDTSAVEGALTSVAQKILQAATDVIVEDQITKYYTMIFDIPTGHQAITGVTDDFYIEFVKYTLDATTHERVDSDNDGDKYDDATSVTKLYLKNTNGTYSAAKDSSGTAYDAPVFEAKIIGDKGTLMFWTTDSSYASKAAVTYTSGETTYYFIPYGMEINEDGTIPSDWYNMTSGGYAHGTVNSVNNMSTDLVIATPYFVYNAKSKMIYWTLDKLQDATTEYALRYFLYLDNSATEVGENDEVDPGSYLTNDHAYITYTNFKGNDCRQEFPKPQLTWSGAQVSYVFYLVNAAGQPINKSGQVVDFANATFVTDTYTENTVWNKGEDGQITADSQLSIDWLAANLLPSDYKVYDEGAQYQLHVYGDHTGESIFDYFTISGNDAATISESLNNRLTNANTTVSTVSLTTTKVYNTKAGTKITGYGTYTSEEASNITGETVLTGFDFYNTTVAFAVVWQPALAPDTVVVDYGLDVLINVTFNDLMQDNTISGIGLGRDAYGTIAENTGVSTTSKLGTADLTTADGSTIHIENDTQIRFSQNDMTFNAPVTFYYESEANYYENSELKTGYLHTSVTVIPATTIYYEDEYVTLKTYTDPVTVKNEDGTETTTYTESIGWTTVGTTANATQAQDRPGKSLISGVLDANNNYGYDAAYSSMSEYSLGSAAMVNVTAGKYATATFDFYGTGFDIISLTSATTGNIVVNVYPYGQYDPANPDPSKAVQSETVNTYYGYKKVVAEDGTVTWEKTATDDTNALYQVPVMKIGDVKTSPALTYGHYTAVITVSYIPFLDQNKTDSGYNFYLDAIRIYNPTGNVNDDANDAYIKDGEAYPAYFEVRDQIIGAGDFNALENDTTISGIVFIDGGIAEPSITDYTSYGPNNETYLANGQAIAFELNGASTVPAEMKLAKIQLAVKTVGGTGKVEVYGVKDGTVVPCLNETIATATDMYYDITALEGMTVVIKSTGSAVISITNVKVTSEPVSTNTVDTTSVEETEAPMLFSIRRSTAEAALATMNVEEEVPETTVPEETEPETTVPEETEPETTVPEETEPETTVPEETEPETTVPEETEPETTVPEETEPEETEPSVEEQVKEVIEKISKVIRKIFGRIFG